MNKLEKWDNPTWICMNMIEDCEVSKEQSLDVNSKTDLVLNVLWKQWVIKKLRFEKI